MIRRLAVVAIVGAALGIPVLSAGDFSSYRGLQFGMSPSAAARESGTPAADATVLHQRPALIQEMEWRPRPRFPADPTKTDPVKGGSLYFLNGELFRIVANYDRYRVEGMTEEDMIQGISRTYGAATRPLEHIAYYSNYRDLAAVLGRWEDSEYSYNLIRTGDRSSYALVLDSKRLLALAQAAIVESARLDALDAPQRELERLKTQEAADRLVLEKARSLNKPNFRP